MESVHLGGGAVGVWWINLPLPVVCLDDLLADLQLHKVLVFTDVRIHKSDVDIFGAGKRRSRFGKLMKDFCV
jgi:hypothetical protein